jgi:subtilase family serine protease
MIRVVQPSFAGTAILAAILVLTCSTRAQERSLITQPVDPTHLTRLAGNTHPLALAKYDQGAAPSSLVMNHLFLVLKRSPSQESALDTLLEQQQDKKSPNYHKWLTPEQYGVQYGASEADVQKIEAWLSSQGFTVNGVSNGRTMIDFSGNAGSVQAAFHTSIHKYLYPNGRMHWANSTDPQIPTALASAIVGVNRLNNFRPKAMSHHRGTYLKEMNSNKVHSAGQKGQFTEAGVDECYEGNTNCYVVGPYDFAKIYNVTPLWNAGTTGTGQTIAIVSDSDVVTSDYTQFRSIFGLPALTMNRVLPTNTNPGVQNCEENSDEEEAILDVEWAGAVAPGATIDLVISPTGGHSCTNVAGESGFDFGGDYSAQYVVDNNTAPILSDSYGECEYGLGTAENAFYNSLWQQAAGEGITVSVASGDSGAAGCDFYEESGSDDVQPAEDGLAVNGTASTPYNIAVGGTDFDYANFNNPSQYWSATNSASGTTSTLSALGYIPEMVWNDSCTNFVLYQGLISGLPDPGTAVAACNNGEYQNADVVGTVGSSGGASNCISAPTDDNPNGPTGCTGGYKKPTWQTGTGVPSDGVRDIPDVSLFAADGEISSTYYAECEADLESEEVGVSGQACSTTVQGSSGEKYVVLEGVGGTSASAQVFAGGVALLVQANGRLGNFNPTLYALANSESASSCSSTSTASSCIFHDVTVGTNAMPCAQGSLNCSGATNSDPIGVLSGYAAGTGFDLATGLGTLNFANLAAAIGTPSFTLAAGTTSITIPSGSSTGTVTIDASALGAFTGNVATFTCTGLPSGATCAASGAISLSGAGTAGSTTLTITLASAASHLQPLARPSSNRPSSPASLARASALAPALVVLLTFGSFIALYAKPRRQVVAPAFALLALGALLVITSACGGGGSTSSVGGGGGTTSTSYTVTVTGATSTGTPTATTSFTLVVD